MAKIPNLPTSLFAKASREVRSHAVRQMRNSALGRGAAQLQREVRRTNRSTKRLGSLAAGIKRAARRGLGGAVKELTLGQLERYARRNPTAKIIGSFFDALGPFGRVIKSLLGPIRENKTDLQNSLGVATEFLRAFGYGVVAPPSRGGPNDQLDQMADLLRQHGYKVEKSPKGQGSKVSGQPRPSGRRRGDPSVRQFPGGIRPVPGRKTVDFPLPGGGKKRIAKTDPLFTGEMVRVQSSNVHSIGFVLHPDSPQSGTLRVRFYQSDVKQTGPGKRRSVAGPMYEYYHVDAELFMRFKRVGSKGKFVWDELRKRGTVSGHQYDYRLKGISQHYVPRKATFGSFTDPTTGVMTFGESFEPRGFTTRAGTTFRSSLGAQRTSFLQTGAPNTGQPRAA